MTTQATCRERWYKEKTSRLADLRKVWKAYQDRNEDGAEDLGSIHDYGLSFDYVPADTFNGQKRGYFRYQFSWGGPSDEVRYYVDFDRTPQRITYVFMDWFDGHERTLQGADKALMLDLWAWFYELGLPQSEVGEDHSGLASSPYEKSQTLDEIKMNWRTHRTRYLCPTCNDRLYNCRRDNPPASGLYCATCKRLR